MTSLKRFWLKAVGGSLAVFILSPAWGAVPPQPGVINYIEGQATVGGQVLAAKSAGSAVLAPGQSLSTDNGRVEILLTPGIFFRVGDHSSVQMTSSRLTDTTVGLDKGRAMVEVANILPQNNVRVTEGGASTQLLKPGLYDFDADHGVVRVFDGKAMVQDGDRNIEVKSGHQLDLKAAGKLKARSFDKKAYTDDFYQWASLRASYLAEANVDAASRYGGVGGYSPTVWAGNGWYWDPWYSAYTYIPADGIFFDPFGWGFYSPWSVFASPYFGLGYGGFGYGGFGYGFGLGGYYHRFGPGYHPPRYAIAGGRAPGALGRAHSVSGATVRGFARSGGFANGGGFARGGAVRGFSGAARGGSVGGFSRGGGGFARGGGGGGFHGGGGHGR